MKVATVLSGLVCVMAAVASSDKTPCFPCDPLWPRPYHYPDPENCNIVWQCLNGKLGKYECPPGQVMDFVEQACVVDGPTYLFTCRKMTNTQCNPPTTG
ncbi:hypothetical protein RRG08_032840 [Elysia crispata]|uniref:Chitin-binding type-2 domain-containing protein n=1 Tax=Elysia crispata TaxID=231223 RepID=A0AAE1AG73_9GAST|nr:hypothetical protein RRG08_032840 [Elysia crispata]